MCFTGKETKAEREAETIAQDPKAIKELHNLAPNDFIDRDFSSQTNSQQGFRGSSSWGEG